MPTSVGELLKLTRLKEGYSAQKLGKIAGCSSSHIYMIEEGRSTSETTGARIEDILKLPPRTLPRHGAPAPIVHRPLSQPIPRPLPTPRPAPPSTLIPRARLYLELLDLQSRMKAQGIKAIVLRPGYLEVLDENPS